MPPISSIDTITGVNDMDPDAIADAAKVPATEADSHAEGTPGAKEAATSPGADDKGATTPAPGSREELLAVVKAAIKKPNADGTSPDPKPVLEDPKPALDPTSPEAIAEADKKLPFHTHPRWKEVQAERDSLKAPAEQFNKIATFMRESSLSTADVAEGFQVMAALKNDPETALKMLKPVYEKLLLITGEALPADLQAKVDEGAVDEATARDLARTRSKAELATAKAANTEQRISDDQVQARRAENARAVNSWEATVKTTDPDYERKAPLVHDRIKVVLADMAKRGVSADTLSVAEAQTIARGAYDHVSSRMRTSTRKPELRPLRSGGSSAPAPSVPQTSFEAVKAAAAKFRA